MTHKTLVLIMSNPPYQPGEEFLNSELPFLAKAFDRIIIIHHNPSPPAHSYPFNIELFYLPYLPTRNDKLFSLKWLGSALFWREISYMIFQYKLVPTPTRIASVLGSLAVGKKLNDFIVTNFYQPNQSSLYVYTYWCNFMAVGLALLKRNKRKITCISRAHGYDVFFERSPVNYLPMRNFIFQNLDRVYFISKKGFNYSVSKSGNFPSMRVSYLGCNGAELSSKVENSTTQIVTCSTLIKLKRVDLIIEALSLVESAQKIRWIHFGEGPLFNEIKMLAKERLGSKSNIEFELNGYLPNEEILKRYTKTKIDWFINVSSSEGLPYSIMEAYSAGIPAIATDVGGTSEIVYDHKNGLLLSPAISAIELKKVFESAFSMPAYEWKQLSAKAYQTWNDGFKAEKNLANFVDDFSSISHG